MSTSSPTHPIPTPPRVTDLGRLLLGLVIVTLGVLFLLDSAGVLDADAAIDHWWPALVVAAGVFTLAERPPSLVRGTILTAAGTILLLFTTDVLRGNAWDYLWPSAVILAGLVIVSRWSGRTLPRATADEDVVRSTAIFGGPKLVSTARHFQGAWLTAIFGGITLDLRDAVPAPGGATVSATVAFGGIDLFVPRGWRISVRTTPIFGGLDDKTDHTAALPDDAPVLHVDAVCVFGGVDIKHGK
jgi:predicted membrane protein